ncbi:maturation protein [ssRNA phage Esthiorhiza.2_30]|uniref:Maturation protein n=2 Tax=Fiersviridae TaxID=2842319 RepID=A0A8S5L2U8_9VIRU|nr:maturation protein [ssRNA phage Esthiorhiza.2_30]QDH88010.1 MAG: hypothetical protein H2RhizoLitter491708_000003 [Leviviridae sp.]DAD51719.1 TPA_asm: maturation protein [ssRNA phage Esthiorhiza.2_30]
MVVPAHTQAYGESVLWLPTDWTATGHDDFGNPINVVQHRGYPAGKTLRPGLNKAPWHGDGYCIPKDYSRLIYRVVEYQNYEYIVQSDFGGYVIYSEPLIGSLEPNRPYNYDEWGQDIDAAARTKALNKLRTNSMQLGADLGEAHKTLNMIADPCVRVLKALHAARHGRWGSIPRTLGMDKRDVLTGKFAANKWLEYQYGWRPLLSDIYNGMDRLKDDFSIPSTSMVAKVTANEYRTYEEERIVGNNEFKIKMNGSMRVTYGLFYRVNDATIATIDSAGLLNPISIAWELVPFSFVLDWFIPVGNVLSALSATAGLTFVDGYRSEVRNLSEQFERIPFTYRTTYSTVHTLGLGKYLSLGKVFYRQRLGGFPNPGLYTNPSPFSTKHVANALALLRQLL